MVRLIRHNVITFTILWRNRIIEYLSLKNYNIFNVFLTTVLEITALQ